jgi:hypothetical protein
MSPAFQFTEAEVDFVAQRLGINVSDAERRKVLLHTETCDVQAGPGSGKTTLLATKLAMLAERWTAPDRGICVLSHTNIARAEVEKWLAKFASLQRLLDYPHFIGTIQTFVDQFLALPYLRHQNIEVTAVDNDRFAAVALKHFPKPAFAKLKAYLHNRSQNNPDRVAELIKGLRYSGPNLAITSADGNLGLANTTSPSYMQAKLLKDTVSRQGIFRYDDMFAYAEVALHQRNYLPTLIRQRFPWVFVDEVQDTNSDQDRLLRTLFGEGCVYVRLGDENQAIFADQDSEDGTPSLFNAKTVLPISSSLRFGTQIATFASPLTVARPQSLAGRTDRLPKPHSIFLFDRDSIGDVVPKFGDLVLRECTPEELKSGKVKVVGLRKAKSAGLVRDHFPYCLRDYWDGFIPDIASLSSRPKSLLGYVMEARRFAGGNLSAKLAFDSLMQGILGLLHRQGTLTPDDKRWSRTSLYRALQDASPDTLLKFQDLLRQFCLGTSSFTEAEWKEFLIVLLDCLKCLNLGAGTQEAKDFLAHENLRSTSTAVGTRATAVSNTFTHQSMLGTIEIEVGTIHSAKGETHAATLVVETFSRTHDLQKLLPVLTGQINASTLSGTEKNHCKCIFVGMTRPAHLLGLAMCADHLRNGDAETLRKRGWNIVDLR